MTTMVTWKSFDLSCKIPVQISNAVLNFHPTKKKLIQKMMMGKDTTQKLFIDESRIWNFSPEKIEAANVTLYIFNYMSDENLIKEFWKISDSTPIRDFSKEILVHKDDFIRFVDKKQQKIIIMWFIVVLDNLTRSYS